MTKSGVTTEQPSRSPFAGTTSISPCASFLIKECARACLFLYNVCGGKRSVYEGRLSLLPCVPPVEALPVVAFLLVVVFPPLAALSVEGFPPVAVLVRLREVVVLFVEDEA